MYKPKRTFKLYITNLDPDLNVLEISKAVLTLKYTIGFELSFLDGRFHYRSVTIQWFTTVCSTRAISLSLSDNSRKSFSNRFAVCFICQKFNDVFKRETFGNHIIIQRGIILPISAHFLNIAYIHRLIILIVCAYTN